jgi:hypothetical protein
MSAESKFVPQKKSALWSPGVFAGIVLAMTAMGVGAIVFFFNPSTHGFYPICLFHTLTGLYCPGCGMTRSLYALLHGNLRLALKDNALFVLALVALAVCSARLIQRKLQNRPVHFIIPTKILWSLLAVAFAFTVIRNLPGFEWLSP